MKVTKHSKYQQTFVEGKNKQTKTKIKKLRKDQERRRKKMEKEQKKVEKRYEDAGTLMAKLLNYYSGPGVLHSSH